MAGIQIGTAPEDAIKGLKLIHYKQSYLTNTKNIHWSGADEKDFPEGFLDSVIPQLGVLAIWQGKGKLVIAWVND